MPSLESSTSRFNVSPEQDLSLFLDQAADDINSLLHISLQGIDPESKIKITTHLSYSNLCFHNEVERETQGDYSINISAGTVLAVDDFALFVEPEFKRIWYSHSLEVIDTSEPGLSSLAESSFYDYDWMSNISGIEGKNKSKLSDSFENQELVKHSELSKVISTYILFSILLHEIAHALLGHCDLEVSTENHYSLDLVDTFKIHFASHLSELSRETQLKLISNHAKEIQADTFASINMQRISLSNESELNRIAKSLGLGQKNSSELDILNFYNYINSYTVLLIQNALRHEGASNVYTSSPISRVLNLFAFTEFRDEIHLNLTGFTELDDNVLNAIHRSRILRHLDDLQEFFGLKRVASVDVMTRSTSLLQSVDNFSLSILKESQVNTAIIQTYLWRYPINLFHPTEHFFEDVQIWRISMLFLNSTLGQLLSDHSPIQDVEDQAQALLPMLQDYLDGYVTYVDRDEKSLISETLSKSQKRLEVLDYLDTVRRMSDTQSKLI